MNQINLYTTRVMLIAFLLTTFCSLVSLPAFADTAAEIDAEVVAAKAKLFAGSPEALELSKSSKGLLVFPDVVKAGLIIGGQYGEGALLVNGRTTGYYNTVAASYGLQAGAQSFGYAMLLMTDEALSYVKESDGWEVGTGPTIVVMDKGASGGFTTSSAKEDIYVFFFDQSGLMAGLGLQGTKISKITPD
jgi:lipid-binding SYLF domain-containing protein